MIGAALAASERDAPGAPVAIAYSGGLDSTVLLHGAVRIAGAARLIALHVDHGLQAPSVDWARHCAKRAGALGVRFSELRAAGAPGSGDSVEQWARTQRYRLLFDAARAAGAETLLTAHHADDQLETLLLALDRGCGLDGLTGIAAVDRRAGVVLRRPLLALDRATLRRDAERHHLDWVEDPSNNDATRPRNALRHGAMPALHAALPGLRGSVAATLEALADARAIVAERAAEDLVRARCDGPLAALGALDRRVLVALPAPRRDAALRAWIALHGLRAPSRAKLLEIDAQLVLGTSAAGDVPHDGLRLMRYRDRLLAIDPAGLAAAPSAALRWDGEARITLPDGACIEVDRSAGGLDPDWLAGCMLHIGPVPSGARLRRAPDGPSRTIRNLRQERGIPPWLRDAYPGLWADGRLLVAAPFGQDHAAHWPRRSDGVRIDWRPAPGDTLRAAFAQA